MEGIPHLGGDAYRSRRGNGHSASAGQKELVGVNNLEADTLIFCSAYKLTERDENL